MKRTTLAIAMSVFVSSAMSVSAQEITWKMGFINAIDSTYLITTNQISDRILEATDGRLKIELFDTLYPGSAQVNAVRDGRLDMAAGPNNYLSGETPLFGLGHLPGLIDTPYEYAKVINAFHGDNIEGVWDEKYNSTVLAHGMFDRQVIVATKPIETVEGFKGLKLRVNHYEGGRIVSNLGALPTSVPLSETVVALQRGVVDGIMTSVGTTHGLGFYEVADYIHEWKIGSSVTWSYVANNDSWAALPEDLKEIVSREFKEMETEMFANYDNHSVNMLQAQVDEGMTRIVASSEELGKLFSEENNAKVYGEWYERMSKAGYDGQPMVEMVRALLDK